MKISLKTSDLMHVLDHIKGFVSKNSTLPILENIYIKGNIDTVLFRATDMEKYIEMEIPAKIDDEGALTVNARIFSDIIRNIETESLELHIDTTKNTLQVKTKQDNFSIKGLPAGEYVSVPEIKDGMKVTIDGAMMSKGIEKVSYAVTDKNFSPILTGILMKIKKSEQGYKLVFVGTDSFRLAEYKLSLPDADREISIIIPKMNINELQKVVDHYISIGGSELTCECSENLVSFSCQIGETKILMTSLLIQGNFPDYENENIMPTAFTSTVTVSKDACDKAIKKIGILTKDINNYVSLECGNNQVQILSGATDL
jgi:DNA polymerase-3 subunit beta